MTAGVKILLVLLLVLVVRSNGQSSSANKIDEFEDFGCEELKARTENLYLQLTAMKGSRGYIIIYEGQYRWDSRRYQLPHVGEGNSRIRAIREHMKFLRISDAPIKIRFGGYREHLSAEYFVVPAGGIVPKPSPTLKRMKHRKGPAKFYANPAEC